MKTGIIIGIIFCVLALIFDILSAYNAAINGNLSRLILNIALIGLMLLCLKINISNYKRLKEKEK